MQGYGVWSLAALERHQLSVLVFTQLAAWPVQSISRNVCLSFIGLIVRLCHCLAVVSNKW